MFIAEEREMILEEIAEVEARLGDIHKQSESLRARFATETNHDTKVMMGLQLRTLHYSQQGVKSAQAALQALVAPVNRLPEEILSYIFQFGTVKAVGHEGLFEEDREAVGFPLLVAQICRRWRQVATATPSLWNYITFIHSFPFPMELLWLERSKACLLDVQIDSHIGRKLIKVIIDILHPHFHRIRCFRLSLARHSAIHTCMTLLPTFAPALEDFILLNKIMTSDVIFEPEHVSGMHLFRGGAPKLLHASFNGVHISWDLNAFPFANLTSLHLEAHSEFVRPTYEQFAAILKATPNLSSLKIIDSGPSCGDGMPLSWSEDRIILPVVQFSYQEGAQHVAKELLRRIEFPKVRDVGLSCEGEILQVIDALCERKTFATAETLTIYGEKRSLLTDEIIKYSFGFPNVKELEVKNFPMLLQSLGHPSILCFPKLEKLTVYRKLGGQIAAMLQSRREYHRVPPLQLLNIYESGIGAVAELDLQQLNEHAMKVMVCKDKLRQRLLPYCGPELGEEGEDEDEDEDEGEEEMD